MIPGQEKCSISPGTADCLYAVRVGVDPINYTWTSRKEPTGQLDYDCDITTSLGCDGGSPWKYVKSETYTPTEEELNGKKENVAEVYGDPVLSDDPCAQVGADCYTL